MSPVKKTPAKTVAPPASAANRPVLLLLDGHSLAYRAYYALREADLRTPPGQPTGAVQGFTSMLIKGDPEEGSVIINTAKEVLSNILPGGKKD